MKINPPPLTSRHGKRDVQATEKQLDHRDRGLVRDDLAYIIPMIVFLALVGGGGHWANLYPQFYVARALIVPILLALFWRSYTKIRWDGWWLGAILGVISIVQWVGMQLLLQKIAFHYNEPGGRPHV